MINKCIGICLTALASAVPPSAGAADRAGAMKFSSVQIQDALATSSQGTATATLSTGPDGPKIMAIRRTANGEPEVHEQLDDIFVVKSGHARVIVGGTVSGNRLITPGESRGGTISGGEGFEVGAGDLLWIPAGTPHQVTIPEGGELTYVVLKRPK
jgi:mannose-6-phosphate isomerase-like protein (cupin superfamily)